MENLLYKAVYTKHGDDYTFYKLIQTILISSKKIIKCAENFYGCSTEENIYKYITMLDVICSTFVDDLLNKCQPFAALIINIFKFCVTWSKTFLYRELCTFIFPPNEGHQNINIIFQKNWMPISQGG